MEVERFTLSSVVDGVMRGIQPGSCVVGVVSLNSIVDTLEDDCMSGSSQRVGTLEARVRVCTDLFCGVGAGSRIGLVFRLFENFFRFLFNAASAPKPRKQFVLFLACNLIVFFLISYHINVSYVPLAWTLSWQ